MIILMKHLIGTKHPRHVFFIAAKWLGESDISEAAGVLGHHLRHGQKNVCVLGNFSSIPHRTPPKVGTRPPIFLVSA